MKKILFKLCLVLLPLIVSLLIFTFVLDLFISDCNSSEIKIIIKRILACKNPETYEPLIQIPLDKKYTLADIEEPL